MSDMAVNNLFNLAMVAILAWRIIRLEILMNKLIQKRKPQ